MSGSTWSVQDAKNRFSAMVEAARRKPQTVTRHGRPTVVVLDAEEYARLRRLDADRAPSFVDLLLAMPQGDDAFPRTDVRPRDVEF